jgi:DNA repair ATPase RecN
MRSAMKPINAQELSKSYRLFVLNFIMLTAFTLVCIYFFFAASRYEYAILEDKVKQTDQLLLKRKEINTSFDMILYKFKELSRYTSINSEELNNQAILLEDIQNNNFKIKELIKKQQSAASSFLLYKKMSDDVTQMASIEDSLFNTRFQIENVRTQLESCLHTNQSAADKLRAGRFRR